MSGPIEEVGGEMGSRPQSKTKKRGCKMQVQHRRTIREPSQESRMYPNAQKDEGKEAYYPSDYEN